jgi:signal peptidase I
MVRGPHLAPLPGASRHLFQPHGAKMTTHLPHIFRKGQRLTSALLTFVAVALAAAMLLPTLAGFGRYVITSGSMTGTYDTGSIVYTKQAPVAQLRTGDVITYAPPRGQSPTQLVTHRIVSIRRGPDGRRIFRTKGDANAAADPWKFSLDQPTQARVAFGVPFLGRLVSALSDRQTRMLLIGVPALLVALFAFVQVVRDARESEPSALPQSAGEQA